MVSFAPNTQSYLYNHMSFFIDYESSTKPKTCMLKNSIYEYINCSENTKKFQKIVEKAQMIGFLNDEQINCTIFIPTDDFLHHIDNSYFDNMDIGLARKILSSSIIPRKIGSDLLTSSPVSYFYTKNPNMRMYITNINRITNINNCVNVVKYDIWKENGIIHIIDNLLLPSEDHFMN